MFTRRHATPSVSPSGFHRRALKPLVLAAALSMVAASVAEAGGKKGIAPGNRDGQASISAGKDGGGSAKTGGEAGGRK
jgi:hypothetical protein